MTTEFIKKNIGNEQVISTAFKIIKTLTRDSNSDLKRYAITALTRVGPKQYFSNGKISRVFSLFHFPIIVFLNSVKKSTLSISVIRIFVSLTFLQSAQFLCRQVSVVLWFACLLPRFASSND